MTDETSACRVFLTVSFHTHTTTSQVPLTLHFNFNFAIRFALTFSSELPWSLPTFLCPFAQELLPNDDRVSSVNGPAPRIIHLHQGTYPRFQQRRRFPLALPLRRSSLPILASLHIPVAGRPRTRRHQQQVHHLRVFIIDQLLGLRKHVFLQLLQSGALFDNPAPEKEHPLTPCLVHALRVVFRRCTEIRRVAAFWYTADGYSPADVAQLGASSAAFQSESPATDFVE